MERINEHAPSLMTQMVACNPVQPVDATPSVLKGKDGMYDET
jgi:hypothetical protein